jgi:uracil-DNA glycosylase family 4
MNNKSLVAAYLRQQKELALPDIVFDKGSGAIKTLRTLFTPLAYRVQAPLLQPVRRAAPPVSQGANKVAPVKSVGGSPFSRLTKLSPLSKLPPVAALKPPAQPPPQPATTADATSPRRGSLSFEQKRALLKELYGAKCAKCALATTRKSFVFGSGNVDAPLMIIGEAPGAEEDEQGLPFVGAAGRLLTELLSTHGINRKTDCFITNILKCRPPENRNPDANEIVTCLPLLEKQIGVIAPRALLLLGRIAAHALLGAAESIAKMRAQSHAYKGIVSFVTYHPAAILRNAEYRRPTEEDLQKIYHYLKENGHHGPSL